jgi:signal transduction histidine kinase
MRVNSHASEQELGALSGSVLAPDFNPLAYLLHALNQPLTGLQCSLELAAVGSRTSEQYLRTIREGLDLVGRMRLLVEALREIADITQDGLAQEGLAPGRSTRETSTTGKHVRTEAIALDTVVRGTVDDLRPVAESRALHIDVDGNSYPHLCLVRKDISAALFRVLDSVLSLAAGRSILRVHLRARTEEAAVILEWTEEGGSSRLSSFSAPDLGLLVARAAWLQAGGDWLAEVTQNKHTLTLSLPWVNGGQNLPALAGGGRE